MIPISIELENWQSFRGKHIINLPRGLIQIRGQNLDNEGAESNRAGKTSLLNAISVCLYGRSPLVARSKGFINRDEKWASVMVIFDQGLSIKRFIKHPDYGNKIFEMNGASSPELTQEEVDKLFGSWDAFISTVFFGLSYSDFLEKVLKKPAEAKELLTSLLPKLQVFDVALEWVKKKAKENEESLRQLETKESYCNGQIHSLKKIDYVVKKQVWDQGMVALKDELQQEMMEVESELKAFGKLPDEKKLNKELNNWNIELKLSNDKIANCREESGKLLEKVDSLVENKKKTMRDYKSVSTGICPTCNQPLPKKTIITPKHYEELLNRIETEIGDTKGKYNHSVDEMENAEENKNFATTKITTIRDQLKPIAEIAKLQESIKNKKLELKKTEDEVNPYIEEEKKTLKDIAEAELQLLLIEKSRNRLKDISQYYLFWEKGFGARGIKNFVFDEIIYKLTEMSKQYLDYMTNGTIQIKFDPRKEKKSGGFTETIGLEVSNNGVVLDDFLLWSQSERKKISLAVDLAMNQLLSEMFGSALEFCVFDESFDVFDRLGIELFCKLLRLPLK